MDYGDSIAVGIPRNPIKGMNAVKLSNGKFIAVSDDLIKSSMKELARYEGIFAEPAAAASYAGLVEAIKSNIIKTEESICVIITGNGLKDTASALKTLNEPSLLKDDLEELVKYMNAKRKEDLKNE